MQLGCRHHERCRVTVTDGPREHQEQNMKVLVIEPAEGAGSDSEVAVLEAAGHEVVRCVDGTRQHECNGMPGGSGCPVKGAGVDVAVAVGPSPLAGGGVRCAVRHFVPLVTANPVNTAAIWPATTDATGQSAREQSASEWFAGAVPVVHAEGTGGLLAAVTAAAGSPLARHGELATAELHAVLAHHDITAPGATAVVHRISECLRVELFPCVPVSKRIAHAAAVRVTAALRSYDTTTRGIGVVLSSS